MKFFFSQNWFKLALIMVLLIVGLSYVFYLIPQKEKADFVDKEKCADLAQVFLENQRNWYFDEVDVFNEQYTHNSILGTCLIYFESWEQGLHEPAVHTSNIFDLLTNQVVYKYIWNTQSRLDLPICKASERCFIYHQDFTAKFKELFQENAEFQK